MLIGEKIQLFDALEQVSENTLSTPKAGHQTGSLIPAANFVGEYTQERPMEALIRNLDCAHLKIQKNLFKSYACCRHIHGAAAAVVDLMTHQQVRPEDVVQVTDRTYAAAKQVVDIPRPATLYGRKLTPNTVLQPCSWGVDCWRVCSRSLSRPLPRLSPLMARVSVVLDPAL